MKSETKQVSKATVASTWNRFAQLVLKLDTSEIQIREMKRAYYVGFHTALLTLLHGLDEDKEPTEADVEYLDSLHKECLRFANDIKLGRA